MNLSNFSKLAGGLVFALSMGAIVGIGACSGSGTNGSSGGSGGSNGSTGQPPCTDNTFLELLYSPMYSAVDDGGQTFQIPAVVNGVDQTQIVWSGSPSSAVSFSPDPSTGGTMITTLQPGTVTITAQLMGSGYCGQSILTIDGVTADQWANGSSRYNNGTIITHVGGQTMEVDGGGAACISCHGPSATMTGEFKDIAHTPEQTGGFSDQDLINIINNGEVPDGGYFDASILPYAFWQSFHKWDVDPNTVQDVVYYLRSLTPSAQDGTSAFGGNYCPPDAGSGGCHHGGVLPDGGREYGGGYPDGGHPGGHHYPDGGHP